MKILKLTEGSSCMFMTLTMDDLKNLLNMIDSAQLPERRAFNNIKNQIKEILNGKEKSL